MKRVLLFALMAALLFAFGCTDVRQQDGNQTKNIEESEKEHNQEASSNIVVTGQGEWLENKADSYDVIVIVSNQSFYIPKIRMSGDMNGVTVFDDEFVVGDQHVYSYYYIEAEKGDYSFSISTEDTKLNKTIQLKEDRTLWMYITYWNSENENEYIDVLIQNEQIGLD